MIYSLVTTLAVQVFALLFVPIVVKNHGDRHQHYEWVRAIDHGKGRDEEDWTHDTWPNIHTPAVVFNGALLMIGKNYTWVSYDGTSWTRRQHNGLWGVRYGSAHVVFAG